MADPHEYIKWLERDMKQWNDHTKTYDRGPEFGMISILLGLCKAQQEQIDSLLAVKDA